ncbi:MAG: right-handed parallel beta-helix repeat-containing protein, partial [Candidatus Omnitrophica bacterium]|nr:right-handed parallel beta-helix repeat-containing protein [Candidatus Omnitrophota bacterium]
MYRFNRLPGLKHFLVCLTACVFITMAPRSAFCDVEEGKTKLIEEKDIYAADAEFDEALGIDPNDPAANFWKAVTVIATNSDLKGTLMGIEIFGEAGDGDPTEDQLFLDEVNEPKYQETGIDAVILDNSASSGYTETGTGWDVPAETPKSPYGADCRVHSAGSGSNMAAWEMSVPVSGYYDVIVWIPDVGNNSYSHDYTIYYEGGSTALTRHYSSKNEWKGLGRFKFSSTQPARIELTDSASSGLVVADAVKLEYKGDFIDDMAASVSGAWSNIPDSTAFGLSYKEIASGSTGTLTWTPVIPSDGRYRLYATWHCASDGATNASFIVTPQGEAPITVTVDQTGSYFNSESLGLFALKAGTANTIVLSSAGADGRVSVDHIRLEPVRLFPAADKIQADLSSTTAQVDQAIGYLNNITSSFQDTADFHVKDSLGNPMDIEIDYGDVLMFKSALNAFKHNLHVAAAFDLDNIDPVEIGAAYGLTVNDILGQFANLGELAPGGAAHLTAAKTALQASINGYLEAYDSIITESDNQDDDLIVFDEGYEDRDAPVLHEFLQDILDNLGGSIPYFYFDTEEWSGISGGDDSYMKLAIDLSELYDDPAAIRDLLPTFTDEGEVVRSSFPDPTFGGILPETEQGELNDWLQKGPEFKSAQITWNGETPNASFTWTRDPNIDFQRYAVYRAEDGNVSELSMPVFESTNQDTLSFTDTTLNPGQRVYYYRLYTYYTPGDKCASIIRKAVTTVYVSAGATGTEDGSPEHPYADLGDAIDHAAKGSKVRVAAGTYHAADRDLSMWDMDGLILEGGFEPVHWTRDIQAHETIIDATGMSGWQVVAFNNMNSGGIDGFTIRNGTGLTDGCGIGVWRSTNIQIKNCKITNNNRGIGAWEGSSCVIENCTITQNLQSGIDASTSSVTARQCLVQGHNIGINAWDNCSLDVRNCVISNNTQQGINTRSHGTLFNDLITDNGLDGVRFTGADSQGSVTVENCTIARNCANNVYSGGIVFTPYNGGAFTPQVRNCIIANNSGWGLYVYSGSVPVVSYSDVWGNATGNFNGIYTDGGGNIALDPVFVAGPLGSYYLSQIAAGQAATSPCVGTGCCPVSAMGLTSAITRIDGVGDEGTVDMGYHYAAADVNPVIIKYVQPTQNAVAFNLVSGSQYYTDRAYTLTTVPAELSTATWIRTRNGDKSNTSAEFLKFTLTQDGMVYVAYDSRASSRPNWMSDFVNTGMTIGTTDVSLKVYAKFYPAGQVTLGGNM